MGQTLQATPIRPSMWLFGENGSIQVWAAEGDARVRVGVLIGGGAPVIMLNRRLVGTAAEHEAISWALARIAEGGCDYAVWSD